MLPYVLNQQQQCLPVADRRNVPLVSFSVHRPHDIVHLQSPAAAANPPPPDGQRDGVRQQQRAKQQYGHGLRRAHGPARVTARAQPRGLRVVAEQQRRPRVDGPEPVPVPGHVLSPAGVHREDRRVHGLLPATAEHALVRAPVTGRRQGLRALPQRSPVLAQQHEALGYVRRGCRPPAKLRERAHLQEPVLARHAALPAQRADVDGRDHLPVKYVPCMLSYMYVA